MYREHLLKRFLTESDSVHPSESSELLADECGDRWSANPAWYLLSLACEMDPGDGKPYVPSLMEIESRGAGDENGSRSARIYVRWAGAGRHEARMAALEGWLVAQP